MARLVKTNVMPRDASLQDKAAVVNAALNFLLGLATQPDRTFDLESFLSGSQS